MAGRKTHRFTKALGVLLMATCVAPLAHAVPDGYTFKPLRSDEFNGTAWDGDKWEREDDPNQMWLDAYKTADAATLENNEYLGVRVYSTGSGNNLSHHAGRVKSRSKYKYGYFESRIQFDGKPGQWNAFWLFDQKTWLNASGSTEDPANDGVEVDIVENAVMGWNNNFSTADHAPQTLHWNGYGADHQILRNPDNGTLFTSPQSPHQQWHTYGLEWTPDKYVFYIDGVPTWTLLASNGDPVSRIWQEVRFTAEVRDGTWAGLIPAAGYGAKGSAENGLMKVDYFHYYELGSIAGDYDASGQVAQGDLDLVLQNWGDDTTVSGNPAGWINDVPAGQVNQAQLDAVLQNWGASAAPDFGNSAVPEPAGLALLSLGAVLMRCRRSA